MYELVIIFFDVHKKGASLATREAPIGFRGIYLYEKVSILFNVKVPSRSIDRSPWLIDPDIFIFPSPWSDRIRALVESILAVTVI